MIEMWLLTISSLLLSFSSLKPPNRNYNNSYIVLTYTKDIFTLYGVEFRWGGNTGNTHQLGQEDQGRYQGQKQEREYRQYMVV